MVLAEIKAQHSYEPQYKTFDEYYKAELGRSKGDISKLVKVGNYLLGNGFSEETAPEVGYTLLYTSISCFPDKDAEYVIASAQTNSLSEMLQNRRDDAFGSDHTHAYHLGFHCNCGYKTENSDALEDLLNHYEEYLVRNDEWRGSSRSLTNLFRDFANQQNHA